MPRGEWTWEEWSASVTLIFTIGWETQTVGLYLQFVLTLNRNYMKFDGKVNHFVLYLSFEE